MADTTTIPVRHGSRVISALAQSVRAQLIFFVIPVLYLLANAALFSVLEKHGRAPLQAIITDLVIFTIPAGLFVMFIVRMVQYALIEKPQSATLALLSDIKSLFTKPGRIILALPVFAAMVLFNKAMFELKPAIPKLIPFSWDETLMQMDRGVHFGVDPWVLLQPLLGYDIITFAFSCIYNFWFLALFGAWMWFGFQTKSTELRTRFFLSYMLIWWLGGGILALLFSSAGPVYYGLLGLRPDPFAPLMAYHHDVNTRTQLLFLDAQQLLWNGYIGKSAPIGISAFPSIHNATSALFALAFYQHNRKMGWIAIAYCALILIGSVHLGWHYAVDGYAGIALAVLFWKLTGPIARWHASRGSTTLLNQRLAAL